MASSINPNNIDTAYPVAGQDNDSQGFRDNFTNIKTNFEYAEAEIEDIQSKALLKSALTGSTLDNDLAGASLTNAKLQAPRFAKEDIATPAGNVALNFDNGPYHNVGELTGNVNLSFRNLPAAGNYAEWIMEYRQGATKYTVTLDGGVTIGNAAIAGNSANNVITNTVEGTYIYKFSTRDAGASISITDLTHTESRYITLNDLQDVTAASADFADFQARVANIS